MLVRTEYGELPLKQTNAPHIVEGAADVSRRLRARLGSTFVGTAVLDRNGRKIGEIADVVARSDEDGHALLAMIALERGGGHVTISFDELSEAGNGVVMSVVTALSSRAA